ncbi:dihydrofolate reductase family protein [Marinobacterium jannaschii]|uniref:dihydrofolate reductase family protein n=1 Tax=Marinobacterium jannaschii TaxID=64970 RepID=UPI0004861BB2|nr:dihydrofolate reductase family protein [Marinobacterium jannaschii]
MANFVYIATSLDGYIADKDGGLEWLDKIPNPDNVDMGWAAFMAQIDALVMGRNTFDTVCGFDLPWPYEKPVFVLSNSLTEIPEEYRDNVELVAGDLPEVVDRLHERGYKNLYIDGGQTIQGFLQADLIDELIITQIPVLLGSGIPLFGHLARALDFEYVSSTPVLDAMQQTHYRRQR